MKWLDIFEQIQMLSGNQIGNNNQFTPLNIRMAGATVQREIAVDSGCLEAYYTFSTAASTREYALPADFAYVQKNGVRVGTAPCVQIPRRPLRPSDLSGTPTMFYVRGGYIGFDPIPTSVATVTMIYARRPPQYAMNVWYYNLAETTLSCALDVTTTRILATKTVGSTATDFSYTYATSDTVTEMVTAIAASTGMECTIGTGAVGTELCTSLELREDVDILSDGPTLPTMSDTVIPQKSRLFFELEIPDEASEAMLYGILYKLKFADADSGAAGEAWRKYYAHMTTFRAWWLKRYESAQNGRIRDVNGMKGRGSGYYVGPSGLPVIAIP
jgi:hypothetical protein